MRAPLQPDAVPRPFEKLAGRYLAALLVHQRSGAKGSFAPATRLGRRALADGLETLDLARIHDASLAALPPRAGRRSVQATWLRRAGRFFAEACLPLEATHLAAREAARAVRSASVDLALHTARLAASKQKLKRGILRRKTAEENLRKSTRNDAGLLAESHQLQDELRRLAHQIMAAREREKMTLSRELYDQFAQTLVGINLRLQALASSSASHAVDFQKELASTQRLVGESTTLMARYSHAP